MTATLPQAHLSQPEPFRWAGVDLLDYKEADGTFRSVSRQTLTDAEHGQGVSLRYFEVGPGGHTTLEKHEHTHVVIPIRGAGSCLVGTEVFELKLHDGRELWAQVTREEAQQLELAQGQILSVRLPQPRVFAS